MASPLQITVITILLIATAGGLIYAVNDLINDIRRDGGMYRGMAPEHQQFLRDFRNMTTEEQQEVLEQLGYELVPDYTKAYPLYREGRGNR